MAAPSQSLEIQTWPIDRFVLYARNPRKNDAVVDRMCSSIREFGFKIPVLARSDGEVVDGHLRLKAARKLRVDEVPVILCDEWTLAQVKAFRLMVNRSVTWAEWDQELLAPRVEGAELRSSAARLSRWVLTGRHLFCAARWRASSTLAAKRLSERREARSLSSLIVSA